MYGRFKLLNISYNKNMKIREEKGSVSILVIVTVLFIVALLTTMYFSAVNRKNAGDEATKIIKQAYEKNVNNMDDLYATYIENGLYIYTKEDLEQFRERVNSGVSFEGKTVYLMNNIDLNIGNYTEDKDGSISFNEGAIQWEPIGSLTNPFKGTFEGNNYEIYGAYINNEEKNNYGLFGYNSGIIQNLGLNKSYIKTQNKEGRVGGIVGNNSGNIKNCYNKATIIGSFAVGGISGSNSGTIENCYNIGNIQVNSSQTNNIYCGGICGMMNKTSIIKLSYNSGNISVQSSCIDVTKAIKAGGILGSNAENGKVTNCYNSGKIEITKSKINCFIAGIVGGNNGQECEVSNCYNIGNVIIMDNQGTDANLEGGILTGKDENVSNCYYLENTSKQGSSSKVEVKTEEEMKTEEFVKLLGEDIWIIQKGKNNGYPTFR